jgi:L-seryl-tRNA(Ser) seleniumtransferase
VREGADIVMFSGDKLLGGPQAGILVGSRDAIDRVRRHPLMRALRVDKLTYAALEATLEEYASGRARESVPVARMLRLTREEIAARAEAFAARLGTDPYQVSVRDGMSTIGGGSAPGAELPTRLVALAHKTRSADRVLEALRHANPPVIARIEEDCVMVDLRTVSADEQPDLLRILRSLP